MKTVKRACLSCVVMVASFTAQAMEQEPTKNSQLTQEQEQWIINILTNENSQESETELVTDLIKANIGPNYVFQRSTHFGKGRTFPTNFHKKEISLLDYSLQTGAITLFKTLVNMESANINIKDKLGFNLLRTTLYPRSKLTLKQRQEILRILFSKGANPGDAVPILKKYRDNKKFAKTRNELLAFIKNEQKALFIRQRRCMSDTMHYTKYSNKQEKYS